MPLQIYDGHERALVQAADAALRLAAAVIGPLRRRRLIDAPRRILVLRLERIGDLVMVLPALRDLRAIAPAAEIDLIVGEWNMQLARAIPFVTRVEGLSAKWLARGAGGRSTVSLVRAAAAWRGRAYDLAINFEPDIRSNLMLAASGARWSAGWATGGGGPSLDLALDYNPRAHTTDNARRLVSAIFGRSEPTSAVPLLQIPEGANRRANARLSPYARGPLVGIHPGGGRHVKQWEPSKFAEVARRLATERHATIVLTGGPSDRVMADVVKAAVPAERVLDVAGADLDLLDLAALLQRLHVFVTGDTGPMHLAAAVGTPVVAVFGASDPARYAPTATVHRIVRVDLPCSPCNRIRLPPSRCADQTPDCLVNVPAARVLEAALSALDASPALLTGAGRAPA
jgi:heptosyltransferase-2/heptosyltransferase-3